MLDSPRSWVEWWNNESVVTHATWHSNMEVFIKAANPILRFNAHDIILDIGCGPGYLVHFLKDKVKEIHCLDTSQRYLDICRNKFSKEENVFIYKLDESHYTDLSFLKERKFSIVIAMSVIQYYKDIHEVEMLIKNVRSVVSPGASFLIADIPITGSIVLHTYGLLKTAVRMRRLSEITRLLLQIMASKHRQAYSSLGLLVLPEEKLKSLIAKLNLNAEILSLKMTSNEYRRHLLIRF